jgi:hypothetical protein
MLSVAHQWGVLVSGGIIVGLIALYEHFSQRSIYGWPLWSAVIGSLVTAFFLAWRVERQQVERLSVNTLPLTVTELIAVFKDRTDVQGDKLAKAYIGKWINVSGVLGNVSKYMTFVPFVGHAYVTFEHVAETLGRNVFMNFNRKWIPLLTVLRPGESITVFGRIRKITRHDVWLERCELIDVSRTDKPESQDASKDSSATQ